MNSRLKRRLWFYGGLGALSCAGCYAMTDMPGTSFRGELPRPTEDLRAIEVRLERHVRALAETVGERRLGHGDSLARARAYLSQTLGEVDTVQGARVEFEPLTGRGSGASNVIFELAGASQELVVVGAHYDTAPGTPGANDNASGVASALELARRLGTRRHHRSLRFVFFANYPDRGDFVGFVGNLRSRSLVRRAVATFRAAGVFPSEGASLPAFVAGVGWSDHWSFWQLGVPRHHGDGHRHLSRSELSRGQRRTREGRLSGTRARYARAGACD